MPDQLLLERLQLLHQLKHPILFGLVCEKRIRSPTGGAGHGIAQELGHNPFAPVDASLAESRLGRRNRQLQIRSFLGLARLVEIVEFDARLQDIRTLASNGDQRTYPGKQIGHPGNRPNRPDRQRRDHPVDLPAQHAKRRPRTRRHPGDLPDPTAGQLHPGDVRVSAQRTQHVGVDVNARRYPREIVHHDGNGAVVGDFLEERDDRVRVHREVVVARHKHQRKIGAGIARRYRLVDYLPRCLAAAAEGDGDVRAGLEPGSLSGVLD